LYQVIEWLAACLHILAQRSRLIAVVVALAGDLDRFYG
jgi:hypothetical protein